MSNQSNDSVPNISLPKGVGAAIVGHDGKITYVLDPFLTENRWPSVTVDSSSFKTLSAPEKLYEQAVAFLRGAKVLCEATGQAGENLRWSQGSVCYYCINLATELFLKACISRSTGEAAPPTHILCQSYWLFTPKYCRHRSFSFQRRGRYRRQTSKTHWAIEYSLR